MVSLRFVKRQDLDQITLIERQSFPTPYTRAFFETLFESSADLFLVATTNTRKEGKNSHVLGYAVADTFQFKPSDKKRSKSIFQIAGTLEMIKPGLIGYIISVAVHPQYRRQGIGTRLLGELIHLLQEKRCVQVRLEVRLSNESAISMYQKMGFQQVAIVPRYYDGREDAVTMVFEWEAAK